MKKESMKAVRYKLKRSEYLQLTGLLALGNGHAKSLEEIERAMCEITGEEYGGHCGDAIYSGYTVNELLRKLKASK